MFKHGKARTTRVQCHTSVLQFIHVAQALDQQQADDKNVDTTQLSQLYTYRVRSCDHSTFSIGVDMVSHFYAISNDKYSTQKAATARFINDSPRTNLQEHVKELKISAILDKTCALYTTKGDKLRVWDLTWTL